MLKILKIEPGKLFIKIFFSSMIKNNFNKFLNKRFVKLIGEIQQDESNFVGS